MKNYSHFLDYVPAPLPQKFADKKTGAVPIGRLVYQGDQTNFSHQGYGSFACKDCKMCKFMCEAHLNYVVIKNLNPMEELIKNDAANIRSQTFNWLIENLLPINDKFRGCELVFPDTVLFLKGKPTHYVNCDKYWCLQSVRSQNKKGAD